MILTQKSRDWKIERAPRDESAIDISEIHRRKTLALWRKAHPEKGRSC